MKHKSLYKDLLLIYQDADNAFIRAGSLPADDEYMQLYYAAREARAVADRLLKASSERDELSEAGCTRVPPEHSTEEKWIVPHTRPRADSIGRVYDRGHALRVVRARARRAEARAR